MGPEYYRLVTKIGDENVHSKVLQNPISTDISLEIITQDQSLVKMQLFDIHGRLIFNFFESN